MSIQKSIKFTSALTGVTLLAGAILASVQVAADDMATDSTDNLSIAVPVACTLSGTGMKSHNAEIPNGTYKKDIGTTTLKAYCNDSEGFSIYAVGYTNNELGNTNLIGANLGNTIVTGTATSGGNPDTSNWAMKLATDTSTSVTYPLQLLNNYDNYNIVPSTYTKVATRDSGTDAGESATGSTLTTTYAAYISSTERADTYNGQVKFTLVHPASEEPLQPKPAKPGKIVYHPNNSSVVGTMGDQSASNNSNVTLWASNFKRAGYGFAGWNDKYDMTGTNYGPNQTITAPSDVSTNGLSLYAKWIKSAGSMQEFTDQKCLGMSTNDVTALTDERDGNTYAIARLADGKCWMIEDLRLADKDASGNDIELSNTSTHSPSLPLTNSWWYSSSNDNDTKPTSNKLSSPVDPTTTAWCKTHSSNCDDQSMLATNNIINFTTNTSSTQDSDIYSYGNYYNWYSATAGNGKYDISSGNVEGDICPAGWHLPTGKDASGEFGKLDVALGGTGANQSSAEASNRWRTYPNNFVYSGLVNGSSVGGRGSGGYYWSSTAYYSDYAYNLGFFGSGHVYPGTDFNVKYGGFMARCVSGM